MTDFIIIHSSPHHNRYVVYTQEKLFKIQPESLPFHDTQIKEILMDTKRFCFWEPVDDLNLKNKIVQFFKEKGEFNLFTCEFRGVKCEKLLYNTSSCGQSHDEEKSIGMRISHEHIFNFLRHIIESVKILSDKGIEHRDITLANIIVFPTDEENNKKMLLTSLPIIIDFGFSNITTPLIATKNNLNDLMGLFFACRYGMCKLGPRNPISWIVHAIPEDQYSKIKDRLDKFERKEIENNLSFEYLLSLV